MELTIQTILTQLALIQVVIAIAHVQRDAYHAKIIL